MSVSPPAARHPQPQKTMTPDAAAREREEVVVVGGGRRMMCPPLATRRPPHYSCSLRNTIYRCYLVIKSCLMLLQWVSRKRKETMATMFVCPGRGNWSTTAEVWLAHHVIIFHNDYKKILALSDVSMYERDNIACIIWVKMRRYCAVDVWPRWTFERQILSFELWAPWRTNIWREIFLLAQMSSEERSFISVCILRGYWWQNMSLGGQGWWWIVHILSFSAD